MHARYADVSASSRLADIVPCRLVWPHQDNRKENARRLPGVSFSMTGQGYAPVWEWRSRDQLLSESPVAFSVSAEASVLTVSSVAGLSVQQLPDAQQPDFSPVVVETSEVAPSVLS
jgi:hypothetical protein